MTSSAAAAAAVKKRRKSRTAFTNKQIYELEKRFLYQKYLTPADRDEIAQALSLSNAQVTNQSRLSANSEMASHALAVTLHDLNCPYFLVGFQISQFLAE